MLAAVFDSVSSRSGQTAKSQPWLSIEEVPVPEIQPGQILLKVLACGVCRTDLHIVEHDLQPLHPSIIPGHQIVGEVVDGATPDLTLGSRLGVSWIGGVDGDCWYCRHAMENLCDDPTFTGYSVNGGYAEYASVRTDFAFPLPANVPATQIAPLLCAGIIGYRSLRVAGVEPGERVGLYGFGSSASLAIRVLQSWGCEIYVSTRGEQHRKAAENFGATWVGNEAARPPIELDRAITFAPSGTVVVNALSHLRKGGVVAINAIHLDQMPAFDYDKLLWGERQLRSVANMTRQDAREFLALAIDLKLRQDASEFPLSKANEALEAVKHETAGQSTVITI